jgi:hypothetical protein
VHACRHWGQFCGMFFSYRAFNFLCACAYQYTTHHNRSGCCSRARESESSSSSTQGSSVLSVCTATANPAAAAVQTHTQQRFHHSITLLQPPNRKYTILIELFQVLTHAFSTRLLHFELLVFACAPLVRCVNQYWSLRSNVYTLVDFMWKHDRGRTLSYAYT